MAKAIVLTSGGLDSLLAIKLMKKTNIPFKVVHFDIGLTYNKPIMAGQRISKYFGLEYLVKNSIEIDKIDIAKEFYTIILSQHGMNATNVCLEHRIFLLQKAREYMEEQNADFIVTGDIIDQRPLIQNKESLIYADRVAGLENLIFRPLCASSMPQSELLTTYPELKEIMYDLKGFTPKREELAKELQIIDYPTQQITQLRESELDMGKKAFEIFEKDHFINVSHLNRLGIHFEFEDGAKGIIGRTPFESNYLKNFYEKMKPEKGLAFYVNEPEFLFGFIYGENISEEHEHIAPRIFCQTIAPKDVKKSISLVDHDGDILGAKTVSPLHPKEFDLYLSQYDELKDVLCPIIFHYENHELLISNSY